MTSRPLHEGRVVGVLVLAVLAFDGAGADGNEGADDVGGVVSSWFEGALCLGAPATTKWIMINAVTSQIAADLLPERAFSVCGVRTPASAPSPGISVGSTSQMATPFPPL